MLNAEAKINELLYLCIPLKKEMSTMNLMSKEGGTIYISTPILNIKKLNCKIKCS